VSIKGAITKVSLLILMIFSLSGFKDKGVCNIDEDDKRYSNFLYAVGNNSTFNYFTVIKVKNLNTGETKDICTSGKFVVCAIHVELQLDYDDFGEKKAYEYARSKRDRYFGFRNSEALENIGYFEYEPKLIANIQEKYDLNNAIEKIEKDKAFKIELSDMDMKAFAHVLFNLGFLTGENSCYGGALEYINKP
jgi:hypothetical protein